MSPLGLCYRLPAPARMEKVGGESPAGESLHISKPFLLLFLVAVLQRTGEQVATHVGTQA